MRLVTCFATLLSFALSLPTVSAHFIWLVRDAKESTTTRIYFGEDATDNGSEYLSRLQGIEVREVNAKGINVLPVLSERGGMMVSSTQADSLLVTTHDLGVMDRGDSVFRLKYYAKTGPAATNKAWRKSKTSELLKLDIVPSWKDGKLRVRVLFEGQSVADAEVKAFGPEIDFEGTTNSKGVVSFKTGAPGVYSIRARHIQDVGGRIDEKEYGETRHYVTVALSVPSTGSPAAIRLQDIPLPVTSFGAASLQNAVYVYGGHTGSAHSYSTEEQSNELSRLDLSTGQWTTVAQGPHLQGLALVESNGRLFRIGGFTAENAEGEEHRLVSQSTVAVFDTDVKKWSNAPDLPAPRSSHDAAVLNGTIYVVGGWQMSPSTETAWHSTAWKMDTGVADPQWEPIAAPPFERRALAVAAHDEKIFVVGGMDRHNGPTTAVAVYDPAENRWTEGPSLLIADGDAPEGRMSAGRMAGFGASAFATGGSLFVTTVQGVLQRLSDDGQEWTIVKTGLTPRFFHRMLPASDQSFVVLGGSNMSIGKFEAVEILDVADRN